MNEEVRTTISLTAIALIVAPLVYGIFVDLPDVLAEILMVIICIGLAMPIHDVLWGDDYLHRFVEAVKSFLEGSDRSSIGRENPLSTAAIPALDPIGSPRGQLTETTV